MTHIDICCELSFHSGTFRWVIKCFFSPNRNVHAGLALNNYECQHVVLEVHFKACVCSGAPYLFIYRPVKKLRGVVFKIET